MKILHLDIETAPNAAYVWGLYKQNVAISQIIESGYVMCFSAKWHKDSNIVFDSVHNTSASKMLKSVHRLLSEADAVVHYNGAQFDIPTLNKEFILHGMTPPAQYKQIDLITTARKEFRFTSNKLDYIAQQLGLGAKHETKFTLWVDCMQGDSAAWKKMEAYNKQDVRLLEKVYKVMLPWIKGHPNWGLYQDDLLVCPHCGSKHWQAIGWAYTPARIYPKYQCTACHTWFRSAHTNRIERFVEIR